MTGQHIAVGHCTVCRKIKRVHVNQPARPSGLQLGICADCVARDVEVKP